MAHCQSPGAKNIRGPSTRRLARDDKKNRGRRGRVGGDPPAPPWAGDYSVARSIFITLAPVLGYTSLFKIRRSLRRGIHVSGSHRVIIDELSTRLSLVQERAYRNYRSRQINELRPRSASRFHSDARRAWLKRPPQNLHLGIRLVTSKGTEDKRARLTCPPGCRCRYRTP
jgi:hypothetical protein